MLWHIDILICSQNKRDKSLPDFIAVCVPLIFGTFKKPAEHPIIAPPGKTG